MKRDVLDGGLSQADWFPPGQGLSPAADISGTPGDDTLIGTDGDDVITSKMSPKTGNDVVHAGGGDDVIYGGTGVLDSQQVTTLDGGDGHDVIHFDIDSEGAFKSSLIGGAGDDTIYGTRTSVPSGATPGTIAIDGGDGYDTAYLELAGFNPPIGTPAAPTPFPFSNLEHLVIADSGPVYMNVEQIAGVGSNITFINYRSSSDNAQILLTDSGTADFSPSSSAVRVSSSPNDPTARWGRTGPWRASPI